MHNRREYEKYGLRTPDNIDVSKSLENIILVDKDIKQAYQEIFGEALEKYNCKQKRADRRIVDYYDHIKKSKNGEKLFYEDVVQWGDKDDFQNPQTREKAKDALVKYVKDFEERNTNLKLIGAYIHMDEASPHLHLDYIPVAHGYSRGLETRNSLDKAMKQMGYQPEHESRKHNATKLWKDDERLFFGEICRNLGLEVEVERESTRKNLSVEEYKEAKDKMIRSLKQECKAILDEIEPLQELENYVFDELDELKNEKERIESEIDFLQGELDNVKTQKSVLKYQIKTLTAKKNHLRDQRNELASEKGHLEAQIEELVPQIEQEFAQREQQLDEREMNLEIRERQVDQSYYRQQHLNELLEQAEKDNKDKDRRIEALEKENTSLRDEIKALNAKFHEQINKFTEKLKRAFHSLENVVLAIRLLKYGNREFFGIYQFSSRLERLIDGITQYTAQMAQDNGFQDIAKNVQGDQGITKDLKPFIDSPAKKRSCDYDRER